MFIRVQWIDRPGEREEIFRFRYRVARATTGQQPEGGDHARGQLHDDLDERARILVAVDDSSGAVLGTLRALFGRDHPFPESLTEQLDASSMVIAFGEDRICHSGMFMVDPAYRGLTVASQLMAGLVQAMLDVGADIDLCRVDLPQARSWFQLGYRPYGAMVPGPGGQLQVPLALVLRDRDYLSRTGSPLERLVAQAPPDPATARRLAELYPRFEDQLVTPQRLGAFWASVAHATGPLRGASLFEGIAQEQLDPLLRSLPSQHLRANTPLPAGDAREPGLGVLLRGRLGLTMEQGERPFFVSVLQPGEVFGGMAGVHTTPPSARLVALEDTELLMLDDDALASLERADPLAAQRLRHNLADILARRLDATNRQVAGFMRGSPERVPLHSAEPSTPAGAPVYGGESAEALESELLFEAGLGEAGTLLELGCAEGQTTRLLAQLFPEARVVGVDWDPERCARAERLVEAAGLGDHCTFLAGAPTRVPLEAGTADAAYGRLLIQRVQDPLATLRELVRVVRPGGRIVLLDTDDGGLLVHPAPEGLDALLALVARIRASRGGDRHAGRKLPALLHAAGLEAVQVRTLVIGPDRVPLTDLVALAFGHHEPLLRSAGGPSPGERACLEALAALPAQPGALLCIPVVLAWGQVPQTAAPY